MTGGAPDPERYARIKSLFFEASALHGDERATWLASACEGDADLRREVERLLADEGSSSTEDALGAATVTAPGGAPAPASPPPA